MGDPLREVPCGELAPRWSGKHNTRCCAEERISSERTLERLWNRVHLEQGLLAGAVVCAVGLTIAGVAEFDSSPNPRLGLLGLTLLALGAQAIFGSFFLSVLGLSEHSIIRSSRDTGPAVEEPPA